MDKINEYMKKHQVFLPTSFGEEYPEPVKRITCNDGFSISVQANRNVYCEPRKDRAWPYSEVELGFPNESDELIMRYAEDPDFYTETVYPFVPIDVVIELIDKHGGINE